MPSKRPPIVGEVLDDFAVDKKAHEVFISKADRCYKSFRGILERRSEAAQWTNKQHPAYVLQAVETMVSNLLSPSPKWRLRALPLIDSPEIIERARAGARANELLLSHQLTLDGYAQKQRTFDLQGLVTGLTASKQFWISKNGPVRERVFWQDPQYDLYGNDAGSVDRDTVVTREQLVRDDPTFEPIDVRHLIFENGASSLAACKRVTHRVFYSKKRLEELYAEGVYGPEVGGEPLDKLGELSGNAQEHFQREQDLFQTQPHKDDIVLLEQWREGGKRVVTVTDGGLLLCDKPNPFWFDHLDHPYPFVVCSGTPDLFRIHGISEVELMSEIQEMLWTLINQRLDNLQLINNAIFLIAEDVEDPDAFEFAPGERWLVPRPVEETVKSWSPDYRVAEFSLRSEELLRGDVQNITGGMPFLSGTDSGSTDQKTATGVSIITSLAQKRLAAKQQQFIWAKVRIGEHWCALNQQFIKAPRLIPIIGRGGEQAFEEIRPDLLQGRYLFETEMVDESLLRSERRAEASAKFQLFVSAAGTFAATGHPLNLRTVAEDVLEAYDVSDKDRYFAAEPQQLPPQTASPGQPQQAPGANGVGGITSPQLAAGMSTPSNAFSMSPEQFMQRLGAMRGGPQNVAGS